MRKILLVIFVFLFLATGQVQAAGLVPCGGEGEAPCRLCHFFVMVDTILDFILIKLVPVVAVLMLTIGGAMFFFAGANPKYLQMGKDIITSTLIGIAVIFAAFLLVGTILSAIGLAGWTENIYKNWWQEGFFQIPGC